MKIDLLVTVTDLAPEDLMTGTSEIQVTLCFHQAEGRYWKWGQMRMCHVQTQENIQTEGTDTDDTSETRYFVKDTDVGDHLLLCAPIFLSTDRLFVLYLTTYRFSSGVVLLEN